MPDKKHTHNMHCDIVSVGETSTYCISNYRRLSMIELLVEIYSDVDIPRICISIDSAILYLSMNCSITNTKNNGIP